MNFQWFGLLFAMLGIEPRSSHKLGKHLATELAPQPSFSLKYRRCCYWTCLLASQQIAIDSYVAAAPAFGQLFLVFFTPHNP